MLILAYCVIGLACIALLSMVVYMIYALVMTVCEDRRKPLHAGTFRRCYIDRMCPAERAIYDAQIAVEDMAADARLTEAAVLLAKARDKVADYIDGI